jgi:AcrR family transcriptional regulator
MSDTGFERARSAEAKLIRERAILTAAERLGAERGVRGITLTEIAEAVGMHKSALLRYFETREQIFLRLSAAAWRDWGPEVRRELESLKEATPGAVAGMLARTLTSRPLFCDLLAHVPLNLERNVSVESVRSFKLVTHEEVDALIAVLRARMPSLSFEQGLDIVATATSMAGAQWQMATPGPELAELYRSDPRLRHAVVLVEPRLARVLSALIAGFIGD